MGVVLRDKHVYENGAVVVYKRGDVGSDNWHCRIKIPDKDQYKYKSLKTDDLEQARKKALKLFLEVEAKVENDIPVISRTFAQVGKEYLRFQQAKADSGEITQRRVDVIGTHLKHHLNPYVGKKQITSVSEMDWLEFPAWRRKRKNQRGGKTVSDGTIDTEMTSFKAVLSFAAKKNYIHPNKVPTSKLQLAKEAREEFTSEEYKKLVSFMNGWIERGIDERKTWARKTIRLFVLMMIDTGMRPGEASRLKTSDITLASTDDGREVCHVPKWQRLKIIIPMY